MSGARKLILPESLCQSLEAIGKTIGDGFIRPADLVAALAQIVVLPPSVIAKADGEIAFHARLSPRWVPVQEVSHRLYQRSGRDADLLREMSGLEYLLVFHRDGYIREAALAKFDGELTGAFFFAAIAYRLNDWAGMVREAALKAARRTFPKTKPEVVVGAAVFLLDRKRYWQRGGVIFDVLDETFARPDVVDQLAEVFYSSRAGPMGTLLRYALHRSETDKHLMRFATGAFLPAVRQVALESLIKRRATWSSGLKMEWVDKSLGKCRMVTAFASREIAEHHSLEQLIELGVRDRSPAVRRVALDGLIEHRASLGIVDGVVRLLRNDKNKSVRERIEFILAERPDLR